VDANEVSSLSVTGTSARRQRTAIWFLGPLAAALLAFGWSKASTLSSVRDELKAATTAAAETQTKLEALQTKLTATEAKLKSLEGDKAKLTAELATKSAALADFEAKAKAKHGKKPAPQKPHHR
jgi:septal ring factor EnvC (AmiA/AmiB activator)